MKVTNAPSKFLLVLILSLGVPFSQESRHRAYEEYMRRYKAYKRMYYSQYTRPHKVRGICKPSPHWTPINGTGNPVYEKVGQGFIVVLYLINRRCKVCYHELKSLHLWADYYRKIKKKVTIIALNRRGNPFPKTTVSKFPHINIYEEPRDENIFKRLNGRAGDILIYDRCARRQYFFRYPYSSMVQSFVRNGIRNVEYHAETMCGKCSKNWPQKVTTPKITTTERMTTSELLTTTGLSTANLPTTLSTALVNKVKQITSTAVVDVLTSRTDITSLHQDKLFSYDDVKPLDNDVKSPNSDANLSETGVNSSDEDDRSSINDVNSPNNDVNSFTNDVQSSENNSKLINNDVKSSESETTSSENDVTSNSVSLAERKLHKRVLLPAYSSSSHPAKLIPKDFVIHEIDGPYD